MVGSNHGGRHGNMIRVGISKPESSETDPKFSGRNDIDDDTHVSGPDTEGFELPLRKHPENRPDRTSEGNDKFTRLKDSRPLLKLKFKNPYFENQCSWGPHREDERSSIKGQRSKRKRPSPYMDKTPKQESVVENKSLGEIMDANWILKKLGMDAIGKRVEVHQQSDNSWHKGSVTDITVEGASTISVELDDGNVKTFELGEQGIRFLSQKQKRSKMSKD